MTPPADLSDDLVRRRLDAAIRRLYEQAELAALQEAAAPQLDPQIDEAPGFPEPGAKEQASANQANQTDYAPSPPPA